MHPRTCSRLAFQVGEMVGQPALLNSAGQITATSLTGFGTNPSAYRNTTDSFSLRFSLSQR